MSSSAATASTSLLICLLWLPTSPLRRSTTVTSRYSAFRPRSRTSSTSNIGCSPIRMVLPTVLSRSDPHATTLDRGRPGSWSFRARPPIFAGRERASSRMAATGDLVYKCAGGLWPTPRCRKQGVDSGESHPASTPSPFRGGPSLGQRAASFFSALIVSPRRDAAAATSRRRPHGCGKPRPHRHAARGGVATPTSAPPMAFSPSETARVSVASMVLTIGYNWQQQGCGPAPGCRKPRGAGDRRDKMQRPSPARSGPLLGRRAASSFLAARCVRGLCS